MPPERKKEKFQQLMEFEQRRIIDLKEGTFFYRAIAARAQRSSSTVMRVWKKCTDEHRKTRKTGSGRRKVTSSLVDRHLFCRAMNDCTAFSRYLEKGWPTATRCTIIGFVNSLMSAPRGLRTRMSLYRIFYTANCRQLCLMGHSTNSRLMSTEPGKLIGTILFFEMNHAIICGTMMTAFAIDSMLINAVF